MARDAALSFTSALAGELRSAGHRHWSESQTLAPQTRPGTASVSCGAIATVPPPASSTAKPLPSTTRRLHSRKVAVAGMISFRLSNRHSHTQILYSSLNILSLTLLLSTFLLHISLVSFFFAHSKGDQ